MNFRSLLNLRRTVLVELSRENPQAPIGFLAET
jgi:hypothetical protein